MTAEQTLTAEATLPQLTRPPSPRFSSARSTPPRRCRVPAGAMSEESAARHLLPLAGDKQNADN
jgi:hypothetical protein